MILRIHPMVWDEYSDAARYLKERRRGMDMLFLDEIENGFRLVLESPQTDPVIEGSIRRYLLKRFPYGIIYRWEGEEVYILAVMHLRRHPDYWKNRLRTENTSPSVQGEQGFS